MSYPHADPVTLHADAEHGGLRTAVFFSLILILILAYFLIRLLLRLTLGSVPDYGALVACGGALPLALLAIWGLEKGLKRVWHSGRSLHLDSEGIQVQNRVAQNVQLYWGPNMTVTGWGFKLSDYPRAGRERRLSKRWWCVGLQVQDGNRRALAYTFAPPRQAQAWMAQPLPGDAFHELDLEQVYTPPTIPRPFTPPSVPEIPGRLLAGTNGRFWLAEKRRMEEGFELEPDDFEILLARVRANVSA